MASKVKHVENNITAYIHEYNQLIIWWKAQEMNYQTNINSAHFIPTVMESRDLTNPSHPPSINLKLPTR